MIARNRSRASASSRAGPRKVSIKPASVASGVRSSWLALAMKSARICSARFNSVTSCKLSTATAPSAEGWSMRAKRARSWRSTGMVRVNSTTREASPRSTASAAASRMGLRRAAARSRGGDGMPTKSAAAVFAPTIRRRWSSRISGSGTAAIIASAAPRRVCALCTCSRQARASCNTVSRIWSAARPGRGPNLVPALVPSTRLQARQSIRRGRRWR